MLIAQCTVQYARFEPKAQKLTYNGCDVELELLHVPLVEELVCHQLGQLQMDNLKRKPHEIS